MGTKKIFDFLSELKENNNREWFQLHKTEYENARTAMLQITQKLIIGISEFDASVSHLDAKDCLFRIYRDVRFSKDKEPYKTNMGAFMTMGGRKSGHAGYYFHIEPGNSFLAGGIHQPDADYLKAIRNEIYYSGANLISITENKDFKRFFSKIDGDSLVRPPKGFDPDSKYIDLLKLKSFTVFYPLDDAMLAEEKIIERIVPVFKAMLPFNTFLNGALIN